MGDILPDGVVAVAKIPAVGDADPVATDADNWVARDSIVGPSLADGQTGKLDRAFRAGEPGIKEDECADRVP